MYVPAGLSLLCSEGIIARDADSERSLRLVGQQELPIGARPANHCTTLPTVMLVREGGGGGGGGGGREREGERGRVKVNVCVCVCVCVFD